MPRFGVKSLLVGFMVLAAWFSTVAAYPGSADVRNSILILILLSCGFAAVYGQGRQRAFWAGAFAIMFVTQLRASFLTVPRFTIADDLAKWSTGVPRWENPINHNWASSLEYERYVALKDALEGALELSLAIVGGVIAAYIYDRCRRAVR
jgi:hypothetical protein